MPASILLGILLAVALNRKIRFIGFYRTCIFVPFVASAAATGILANFVFNPEFGLVNNLLRVLGLPQQGFLEDPDQAMVVIVVMSLWEQLGFTVVVYLAALQDVPKDLVEAAGRRRLPLQVFRHVTMPQLAPVTVFVAIWQTITALQLFDLVYTTTRGGPLDAHEDHRLLPVRAGVPAAPLRLRLGDRVRAVRGHDADHDGHGRLRPAPQAGGVLMAADVRRGDAGGTRFSPGTCC